MLVPMSTKDLGEARVFGKKISPWLRFWPLENSEEDLSRVPLSKIQGEKHVMDAKAHLLCHTEGSIKGCEPLVDSIMSKMELPTFMTGKQGGGGTGRGLP